jgi:hypothetical protein
MSNVPTLHMSQPELGNEATQTEQSRRGSPKRLPQSTASLGKQSVYASVKHMNSSKVILLKQQQDYKSSQKLQG